MNKTEIIKEYEEQEDKLFIAKILDKIQERDKSNRFVATDFLNMHEKAICEELFQRQKIQNYLFCGGYEEAERVILVLYPDKLEKEVVEKKLDNWITIVRITLPKYNGTYSHKEYLGGIMKLGVKREKIGDIIVVENGADIIVQTDIADFLQTELANLTRFRKSMIEQKSIKDIRKSLLQTEEITIIVASYRIDAVISECLRISRNKASALLEEERIFINGMNCKNGAKSIHIGDKITIRGKGRYEIKEELGSTKKNNIRMRIAKYVS